MFLSLPHVLGIVGSVTWLALNTWLNLEPTMCLYICLPFPLLMGLAYFCILPAKREKASPLEEPINSNSEDMTAPLVPQQPTPMTTMERIKFQIPLFKYTGPLFLVYFSEYLINQVKKRRPIPSPLPLPIYAF